MTYKYNESFMWWFENVYGAEEAKKLDKLARELDEEPIDCVNSQCSSDWCESDHSAFVWIPVKPEDRESWRIKP